MEVILVKSLEVDEGLVNEVLDILNKFPEPVSFSSHPEPLKFRGDMFAPFELNSSKKWEKEIPVYPTDIEEPQILYSRTEPTPFHQKIRPSHTLQWNDIFDALRLFREQNRIPDHIHVILLLDHHNKHNWFSSFDPSMRLNYFVQTSLWDKFVEGCRRFPVAYEAIALIIRRMCSSNYMDLIDLSHKEPKGCMNDLCVDKEQISLKLRTADICPDCMERMVSKGLSPTAVLQALSIFGSIRRQMLYSHHFIALQNPSRLRIQGDKMDIYLTDLDNTRLNLNPLQKVVYLFFLQHPDGVDLVNLDRHEEELMELYRRVSNAESETNMRKSIRLLCHPGDNSLNEKLARIKKAIRSLLGEKMGAHYEIIKTNGKRKILLDRALVHWEQEGNGQ